MRSYPLHMLMHLFLTTNGYIIETSLPNNLNARDTTFPEPTTSASLPSTPLKDCSACQLLGSALGICASLTPGFTTLLPTAQAKCLCYSSTLWQPNVFDGAVKTCADYASTAAPSAYTPLLNLEGFCNGIGDGSGGYVNGGAGGGMATVTTTFTTTIVGSGNGSGSVAGGSGGGAITDGTGSSITGTNGAGSTSMVGSGSVPGGSSAVGTNSSGSSSSLAGVSGSNSVLGPTTHTTIQATFTLTPIATITATGTTSNHGIRKEITTPMVVFISFAIALTLVFL